MGWEADGRFADLFDPDLAEQATMELAAGAGAFMVERARARAPVRATGVDARGRRPGQLRDSIRPSELERVHQRGTTGFRAGAETSDPVAHLVERGTAPHRIEAKRGRWLSFVTVGGRRVRARVVEHPGTEGVHFMGNAVEDTVQAFDQIAGPVLNGWAERQAHAARQR